MKKQIIAAGLLSIVVAGCGSQGPSATQTSGITPGLQEASLTTTTPAFQPYTLVPNDAPIPTVKKDVHRKLIITHHAGQVYLTDIDQHSYDVGRDSHGRLYPCYYDTVTHQDYPLYYDPVRDNYYRVLDRDGDYYCNYIGDPEDEYYRCDQDIDYADYDPAPNDCPIISDGYNTFTYYDPPDYYVHPWRHHHYWAADYWYDSVPLVVGFYFVLNDYHSGGDSWYYGYHNDPHHDRFAYQPGFGRENAIFDRGGRQVNNFVIATPPARLEAPRREWSHFARVYPNHGPAGVFGSRGQHEARSVLTGQIHQTAMGAGRPGEPTQNFRTQRAGFGNQGHFQPNANLGRTTAFHSVQRQGVAQNHSFVQNHPMIRASQQGVQNRIAHTQPTRNFGHAGNFSRPNGRPAPVQHATFTHGNSNAIHRTTSFENRPRETAPQRNNFTFPRRNNAAPQPRSQPQNFGGRQSRPQSFQRPSFQRPASRPVMNQRQNFNIQRPSFSPPQGGFHPNGGGSGGFSHGGGGGGARPNFQPSGGGRPTGNFHAPGGGGGGGRPAGNFHAPPSGGGGQPNQNHGGGPNNRHH